MPVGSKAVEALRAYLPVRDMRAARSRPGACHDAMFLNSQGGRLSPRSVRRILKPYLDSAGLERDASPTRLGTLSPRICSRRPRTSGPFRRCWGILASRPPSITLGSI